MGRPWTADERSSRSLLASRTLLGGTFPVGLEQLHRVNVAHQDLKPSNFLLFGQQTGSKVTDLGGPGERTSRPLATEPPSRVIGRTHHPNCPTAKSRPTSRLRLIFLTLPHARREGVSRGTALFRAILTPGSAHPGSPGRDWPSFAGLVIGRIGFAGSHPPGGSGTGHQWVTSISSSEPRNHHWPTAPTQ